MTQASNLGKGGSNFNSTGQLSLTTGVTGILPVANGGTGSTTTTGAANSILPSQTSNSGKYLTTNGTDTSWGTITIPVAFPSGTVMLFVQTAAPTGWTKSTANDNKALRVVSGSASTGGSVAFTTAFASQAVAGSIANTTAGGTVGATTLTTSQIPSHNHDPAVTGIPYPSAGSYLGSGSTAFSGGGGAAFGTGGTSFATASAGGGGSHDHSFSGSAHNHSFTGTAINLAVQYVDVIIATKD
jgi:hypothetical protein